VGRCRPRSGVFSNGWSAGAGLASTSPVTTWPELDRLDQIAGCTTSPGAVENEHALFSLFAIALGVDHFPGLGREIGVQREIIRPRGKKSVERRGPPHLVRGGEFSVSRVEGDDVHAEGAGPQGDFLRCGRGPTMPMVL